MPPKKTVPTPEGSPGRLRGPVLTAVFGVALLAVMQLACGQEPSRPLEQAAALRAAGRLDEALDALRMESREIKRIDGDESPRLLPINDLAAEILIDKGELEAAEALLEKTIAAREKLSKAGGAASAGDSWLTLSRLHATAKRFPAAVAAARRAILAADQATGPGSEAVIRAREVLEGVIDSLVKLLGDSDRATLAARTEAAEDFESLGMLGAAVRQRRGILAGVDRSDGDARASAVAETSNLLWNAGEADEAMSLVEAEIDATKGDGPDLTASLRLLGQLQLAADQLISAEATLQEVLEMTRADTGAPTIKSSADRCRRELASLRRSPAQPPPDWLEQTLTTLAKTPAGEAPAGVAGLLAAADLLTELGRPAASVTALKTAFGLASSGRTPSARLVAETAGRLAAAQLAGGDAPAAEKLASQALATAAASLGPGAPPVSRLRIMLAEALRQQGKIEQAAELARQSLARGLPRRDDREEELFIGVFDRLAEEPNQENLRADYVAARARQFGDGHPHVGLAWTLFGSARLAAGDWAAAREWLAQAVTVQAASRGDDDPEVAAALTLLAYAELGAGEPLRAGESARKAMALWERIAGADHPGTLEAVDVLAAAQLEAGQMQGLADLLERLCAAPVADPLRRAQNLVSLAEVTAAGDKARALKRLQAAFAMPCWQPDAVLSATDRIRLARTAARAAGVFRAIGAEEAALESVRKARSLALQSPDPAAALEAVEELAARPVRR